MIDLHTHSTVSDGSLSPAALVAEAANKEIRVLALTDHDTLAGNDEAAEAARSAGIGFIPGIEISGNWTGSSKVPGLGPGAEMHILGLGLGSPSPAFLAAIAALAARRLARNLHILDLMHELSIDATWEEILAISGGNSIGRPHFATLLVQKKIVRNQEQAFSRYLTPGKPLYVPKVGLNFEEAAGIIRESGGIPVLAHPMSLFVAWGRLPDLVKALKERGLMGLEAWHPMAKPKYCRRLQTLAENLDLYVTEGSDFHGNLRPDRRLGHSGKDRKIVENILTETALGRAFPGILPQGQIKFDT